jgi:hypothetical protein
MEPLKPFDKITEPDGRWDTFKISLPRLYEIVDSMTLNDNVPEYVRVQFQQAQHLLIYSHLQFSLLAVALTQSLIAVECATMKRWKDDSAKPKGSFKSLPGFKALLQHAFDEKWVDGIDPILIQTLPTLRNASAHGEYNLNPIDTLDLAGICGKLIQQLYP